MDTHVQRLKEATAFLKNKIPHPIKTAIILGSGLGNLVESIQIQESIPYSTIPNFPISTIEGHSGTLIVGYLNGVAIIAMSGRFHFYEGYNSNEVVFPIRVLSSLGIKNMLLSNAAGGVNTQYKIGDLMIIKDHIGLFVPNPLVGKNLPEFGTRFPDMSEPYSKQFISIAKKIALDNQLFLHEGVYVGVTGPSYETRAEYNVILTLGGDVVGMSTVQENIVAVHCGIKVFGISIITDVGIRTEDNIITHDEVLIAAKSAEPKLTILFKNLVKEIELI
ncbi:MAG: purine-nucleoside phosphorylase [Sediminibacterium sp.]|nr:purine-nucleoside phosphorylase [Sediminibacterium sp.]